MLIDKLNKSGIDIYIGKLQNALYNKLISAWPIGTVYNSYPRCYRYTKEGKYYVVFKNDDSSSEYKDILWDDKLDALSFFGFDKTIRRGTRHETSCHFVLMCNLKKLKPNSLGRADEEIRSDLSTIIGKCLYSFHYVSVETEVENVFREYPGSRELIKNVLNNHPLFCLRINLNIAYNNLISSSLKLN